ncbi:MAG TPA: [citrate (pro-3S)-lyase] ligase [Clostridiaceae bacterium]|nr:[citrate (pro-3S)-lyase] ligase [Clostridiaceae bacterium]
MYTQKLDLDSAPVKQQWLDLLSRAGIRSEQVDETWGLFVDQQLVATGSRQNNILKCVAVAPEFQVGKAFDQIVARLLRSVKDYQAEVMSELKRRIDFGAEELVDIYLVPGWDSVFVYTSAISAQAFAWHGFETLDFVDHKLVFMEKAGSSGGITAYLNYLRQRTSLFLARSESGELSELNAGFYERVEASDSGPLPDDSISALVMHANPFTLGHLYLAELAAKESSLVHLFVLSEDRSLFPAADRFFLVEEATAHIPNLIVHPTGPYLVSSATFPSYFLEDVEEVTGLQAELDARIFMHHVAPALSIRRRYLGTEPLSRTTELYNNVMREVFSGELGLVIVPRVESPDGRPISAARVRKAYANEKWQLLADLVPPATLAYLREHREITSNMN